MSLRLMGDSSIVPVVMFHSIGGETLDWVYNHVAEPVEAFESKIVSLKNAGFNFILWDELYAYMKGEQSLDLPAVMLTFDDGYLDNWVYAYPILKKHGAKGTIYVSSDFVDTSDKLRPNLEDVASGSVSRDKLDIRGFLNWNEMRAMEASGVIDIQSHASTHTWYFKNSNIVDFWSPGSNDHPWMAWNARPDRKALYLRESQADCVGFGTPIYEHDKALSVTRFVPARAIEQEMRDFVQSNGGAEYFGKDGWKQGLFNKHEQVFSAFEKDCSIETKIERRERILGELIHSRDVIGSALGKSVDYVCWPGGSYDDVTLDVAREVGFKSWTLSSRDLSSFRNRANTNATQVKRIGSAIRQQWRGVDLGFTLGDEFLCTVKCHQGSAFHKWKGRILKGTRLIKHYSGV